LTDIFIAILVYGQMDGAKRAPAYFLFDYVLVDAVLGSAVILAGCVFGPSIEGFLQSAGSANLSLATRSINTNLDPAWQGWLTVLMSSRAFVRSRGSTLRLVIDISM
jgi:hypothetical protein